jgi:peptide-methionine (S)-S-oxide reductase
LRETCKPAAGRAVCFGKAHDSNASIFRFRSPVVSTRITFRTVLIGMLVSLAVLAGCSRQVPGRVAQSLPAPRLDTSPAAQGEQVAVLAGGCFWGLQLVFEHVDGVRRVEAGYSGGAAATAHYPLVGTGTTGHAESVRIRFDPSRVSYGQLLQVYFSVATDPTQLDRQGPDVGPQYRSAIFYGSPEQKRAAEAYIAQLTAAKAFAAPIVTQVVPLRAFYPAESWHQDYARLHPHDPYIVYNDAPKAVRLRQRFPTLYRSQPEAVTPVRVY